MSLTPSTMIPLGMVAPNFSLPNFNPAAGGVGGALAGDSAGAKKVSLQDFKNAKGLLVIFMCNHCPYVEHIKPALAQFARDYQPKGLAIVGINSNDVENYPEDSPSRMMGDAKEFGYTFPYLYDESQAVAKAYKAACTPDFFLFDAALRLVYRGQFDDSRPGNRKPATGADLRAAADALLSARHIPSTQKPSMGCNIKWK